MSGFVQCNTFEWELFSCISSCFYHSTVAIHLSAISMSSDAYLSPCPQRAAPKCNGSQVLKVETDSRGCQQFSCGEKWNWVRRGNLTAKCLTSMKSYDLFIDPRCPRGLLRQCTKLLGAFDMVVARSVVKRLANLFWRQVVTDNALQYWSRFATSDKLSMTTGASLESRHVNWNLVFKFWRWPRSHLA